MRWPSEEALRAWDLEDVNLLAGGAGESWRGGDLVLKPVDDEPRAVALADGLSRVGGDSSVRFARPVRTVEGRWTAWGWSAWTWMPGASEVLPWEELVDLSRRFHRAVEVVPATSVLPVRDRWALADRAAWGELDAHGWPEGLRALVQRVRPVDAPSQLVHGDLAGNVVTHDVLGPAVIDISPYWRPVPYAEAVLILDLVARGRAGEDAIEAHITRHGEQYALRACIFRMRSSPEHWQAYVPMAERLLGGTGLSLEWVEVPAMVSGAPFERSTCVAGTSTVDLYVPVERGRGGSILLLHGSGARERDVMAPLAQQLAAGGVPVVVPDWSSSSGSLVADLDDAFGAAVVQAAGGPVVLAGWSAGGGAAWWLAARHPELTGGVALIASSLGPVAGLPPVSSEWPVGVGVTVVTGSNDTIVPAAATRRAVRDLRRLGVRVEHQEVDADHAGVIGTAYDAVAGRCVPSEDTAVLAAVDRCARAVRRLVAGRLSDG